MLHQLDIFGSISHYYVVDRYDKILFVTCYYDIARQKAREIYISQYLAYERKLKQFIFDHSISDQEPLEPIIKVLNEKNQVSVLLI